MKLRELEAHLQDVRGFGDPKIELEQYPTSAHLAARMLYTARYVYDDIEDKAVADLGCGCGILSIAAAMLGASYNLGVDVDPSALAIAAENSSELEVDVDLVLRDVVEGAEGRPPLLDAEPGGPSSSAGHPPAGLPAGLRPRSFDTVVLNPPFGTRTKGVDVLFLKAAAELSRCAVYSLHKTSTRDFIVRKAKEWGFACEVIAMMKFDIPKMYKFHKKKSVDVEVDLLRLSRIPGR